MRRRPDGDSVTFLRGAGVLDEGQQQCCLAEASSPKLAPLKFFVKAHTRSRARSPDPRSLTPTPLARRGAACSELRDDYRWKDVVRRHGLGWNRFQ
jgi:hypothetical protein